MADRTAHDRGLREDRKRLAGRGRPAALSRLDTPDPRYRPPSSDLTGPGETWGTLSEEELAAFAGEDAERTHGVDYYVGQLRRARAHAGSGFNGAAAIFGTTWCFYRKRYRQGILLALAELATSAIVWAVVAGTGMLPVDDPETETITALIALIAVRVPFGQMANRLYLQAAEAAARTARASGDPREDIRQTLTGRGGPFATGIALSILAQLGLQTLVTFLGLAAA